LSGKDEKIFNQSLYRIALSLVFSRAKMLRKDDWTVRRLID